MKKCSFILLVVALALLSACNSSKDFSSQKKEDIFCKGSQVETIYTFTIMVADTTKLMKGHIIIGADTDNDGKDDFIFISEKGITKGLSKKKLPVRANFSQMSKPKEMRSERPCAYYLTDFPKDTTAAK